MHLVSNLGVQGEFTAEVSQANNAPQKKSEIKLPSTAKEEQL